MLIGLDYLVQKYEMKIRGVVHVGAHIAQESEAYESVGISNVLWIEAFHPFYLKTVDKVGDKLGNKVLNVAILDEAKEMTLFVTNNEQSTSLLRLKTHLDHYPGIVPVSEQIVRTERLDSLGIDLTAYNFINLDIQGVELRAIKSLGDKLAGIDYIYTEVNREELYEGCDTIEPMDAYLAEHGFKRVETFWTEQNWGDALYLR